MRVRRHLIRLHLTLRSLDIPIFHTEMAGGSSSSSRHLSPSPLSCLYHGLSGHSKGQSKHQRRYICELCRLWEGEEDRGGRCLHAWHGPTSSFGDQTTISLGGGKGGSQLRRWGGGEAAASRGGDQTTINRDTGGGEVSRGAWGGGGSRFEGRRPSDSQPRRSAGGEGESVEAPGRGE